MSNAFQVLTLSYKHAPIAIREKVALQEAGCRMLLERIKEFTPAREVLVLSTCNRTEVYYKSSEDLSDTIIKLLALEKGFSDVQQVHAYFQHITREEQALTHLFRVALGLESQVVGDFQILNQVKLAYQWSADAGLAGPFLHRLLHTVFSANKRVVNETAFRDGAASVAYATVELVEELCREIEDPRVLLVGLGDIGSNVCANFGKSSIRNLVVCNRTFAKAQDLAQRTGARAVAWDQVINQVREADVVICSVPGDSFFLSRDQVEALGENGPRFFLDLSMPRSIDDELSQLPGRKVYNVDTIKTRAGEALERRVASIPQVLGILEESLADFGAWSREMVISPALQQFKKHLEQIRQQEIARALKHMGPAEQQLVEAVTASILNKIVKLPALELKAACQRGDSESLMEGLSQLFNLDKQEV
ncbi:MAG: glutamyl-tRNA reductase [Adhaeribacter sp.]